MKKYTYLLLFLLCLTGCYKANIGDKVVLTTSGSIKQQYTVIGYHDTLGMFRYILVDSEGNISQQYSSSIIKLPKNVNYEVNQLIKETN
jgi:hypothetical protein